MKPGAVNLHIGRLVLDAASGEAVTLAGIADAVQAELAAQLIGGDRAAQGAREHSPQTVRLSAAIADGVASRLAGLEIDVSPSARGGRDGAL